MTATSWRPVTNVVASLLAITSTNYHRNGKTSARWGSLVGNKFDWGQMTKGDKSRRQGVECQSSRSNALTSRIPVCWIHGKKFRQEQFSPLGRYPCPLQAGAAGVGGRCDNSGRGEKAAAKARREQVRQNRRNRRSKGAPFEPSVPGPGTPLDGPGTPLGAVTETITQTLKWSRTPTLSFEVKGRSDAQPMRRNTNSPKMRQG